MKAAGFEVTFKVNFVLRCDDAQVAQDAVRDWHRRVINDGLELDFEFDSTDLRVQTLMETDDE